MKHIMKVLMTLLALALLTFDYRQVIACEQDGEEVQIDVEFSV